MVKIVLALFVLTHLFGCVSRSNYTEREEPYYRYIPNSESNVVLEATISQHQAQLKFISSGVHKKQSKIRYKVCERGVGCRAEIKEKAWEDYWEARSPSCNAFLNERCKKYVYKNFDRFRLASSEINKGSFTLGSVFRGCKDIKVVAEQDVSLSHELLLSSNNIDFTRDFVEFSLTFNGRRSPTSYCINCDKDPEFDCE